jgi:hypothetical protein
LAVKKGILKPGNSPGVLTINGSYDQEADGVLGIELSRAIGGPIACDGTGCYSRLVVTGGVTLENGRLRVGLDSPVEIGDLYGIVDNRDSSSVNGFFEGLSEDDTFSSSFGATVYIFQISYDGDIISPSFVTFDGGNDIVLRVIGATVAPEPPTFWLALCGWMMLAASQVWRRRPLRTTSRSAVAFSPNPSS